MINGMRRRKKKKSTARWWWFAIPVESNMTALLREAASFTPGYERDLPVVPHVLDRLVEAYRFA